ncbi:autotransporter outer membrane beta-barrel domain-containing protein [Yersinia mollaretii]|uniref:autotransporter outer membrane beta-barrel domain-containing protein n=1 Tax=Yersinia mollaretii TaxID=33060 RepID=UPI0011A2C305|nr:autotransporter outer membrane beta-barrel domain-containing protein [Yersinia mollaretii]
MNKFYRVIWNATLGRYIVASELAQGRTKSKSSSVGEKIADVIFSRKVLLTCILSLLAIEKSHAANSEVGFYTPSDSAYSIYSSPITLIQGGSGGFANIASGDNGFNIVTLEQAAQLGLISTGDEYVSAQAFFIGNKSQSISYTDPITQNKESIAVYDNQQMSTFSLATYEAPLNYAVGDDGQYVDKKLMSIQSGGIVDVNVGSSGNDWTTNAANKVSAIMKGTQAGVTTSSVFDVSGTGMLNYNAKTVASLGNRNSTEDGGYTAYFNSGFSGLVHSSIGDFNVNNIQDFKVYNTALQTAIANGTLDPLQYDAEIAKGYQQNIKQIVIDRQVNDPNDAVNIPIDRERIAFIRADGSDAQVNVSHDANIELFNSDASLISLLNGATLNNLGTLGSAANTLYGAYVILANNSNINNSGVIDIGTNSEMNNSIGNVGIGSQFGINSIGNTKILNDGVINVAPRQDYAGSIGALLANTSSLINNGSINIAAAAQQGPVNGVFNATGVIVQDVATFDNNGDIYIGRLAQRAVSDLTADVAVNSPGTLGVSINHGGTFTNNATGTMTIGSLTQGATAIQVVGAGSVVTQNGIINVNGSAVDINNSSQKNIAIDVSEAASLVENKGTINLNGINSIGLRVSTGSAATNSGNIIINQGVDPLTQTANYGIWSEGVGAITTQSGTVVLNGNGAIGIHARNKGTVNLEGNSEVEFSSGENQIGYFIYGAGSSINSESTHEQNVSTKGSTLYRIDGGSSFAGSADSTSMMKASGENSTILLVTGKSDDGKTISKLNTGKMVLNVDAEGATAVKVEGGAQGVLDQGVLLALTAKNATAGIVDGNSTTITGAAGKSGASQLTSYATLDNSNAASDAIGYIARNKGTLIHKGSLTFTADNSTGVLVDGGNLENSSEITVNGIAVDIVGGDSKVTNTGTVKATGGTAAYRLKDGASLALSGQGTTIAQNGAHGVLIDVPSSTATAVSELTVTDATVSVSGTGNAIENGAEVAGIRLVNAKLNVDQGAGIRSGAELGTSNSGVITVSGSGAGIMLKQANGSSTTVDLNLLDSDGLTINVTGANGMGIVTNTSGEVKNGTAINVMANDGGSALVVGGTTTNVVQSGKLTSRSITNEVVNLNNGKVNTFTNNGSIKANSSDQVAVASHSGAGMTLTNSAGASIVGKVNLLTGNNTVNLLSGSTGTDFYTGEGRDVFNLKNIKSSETSIFTSLNGGVGEDVLNLDNSAYVLKNVNALTGFETVNLTHGSIFTEENTLLALGDDANDSTGTVFNIDATSILALTNSADVAFQSHLHGMGTVQADLSNQTFSFTDNNKEDAFAGTLDLSNSKFALEGINSEALKAANLKLSNGSVATIGAGQQNIGGLVFNGGTADFGELNPGVKEASNTIHTANTLDISGQGVVKVELNGVINDNPLPVNHLSLMEQDDAQTLVKIADSAGVVIGSGGNLTLKDSHDEIITDAVLVDITQAGGTVAKGTWDYRLTSGDKSDGLYINYGLTQVELLAQGADALVLNANGATGAASDLSAKVTGMGDLHIDTGTSTVSLSHQDNDYLGETVVASGTLALGNDNVLGQTHNLLIESGARVNTQGHSQKIGALNTATGSQLNLSAGSELTIIATQRSAGNLDGGTINADTLMGSGKLNLDLGLVTVNGANSSYTGDVMLEGGSQALLNNVSGLGDSGLVTLTDKEDRLTFAKQLATDAAAVGELGKQLAGAGTVDMKDSADITLTADNSAFSGEFQIDNGSDLRASAAQNLGEASVANNGSVHLTADNDWELTNAVTGSGDLEKLGSATLIVNRDLAYTGDTNLRAGRLVLGDNAAASGKLSGNGAVNIAVGTILGGNGEITGRVNNLGILSALNALSGYENQSVSNLTVGNLNNSGVIKLAGSAAGNTLTISGHYVGNNGLLSLNTVLGDDHSLTDKLVVKGDTSGSTRVQVNNLGGSGDVTNKGIEVVHVEGDSGGNFTLEGRVVAGAYDYFLNKGQAQDGNWYLQSQLPTPITPIHVIIPVYPDEPIVRPEAGAYTANIAAANTMFVTTLHDRLGETNYVDMLTGEEKVTSMWLRNIGGHTAFRDNSGQLKTQSNRYVVQMGGDIVQWGEEGGNRTHIGMMAGYGNNQSNTRSSVTGYSADGSVNGYSVGIYGTWLENEMEHRGAYVDTWAQYSRFNNSVKGDELASESYKSKGVTASVETGYTFKTGEFKDSNGTMNAVYVQPQAQVIWMGVKANDHTETNGTRVGSQGDGNLMTRLGVRTYFNGHNKIDDGKHREFQPFVEANWIHNTKNFGTTMDGVSSSMDGAKNIAEIKVGVEGQLNNNLNLWGNVGTQVGDKGYNNNAAMIGVKYNFK